MAVILSVPAVWARGGASPSRYWAVSQDATVLVSTGGEQAILLGARQPWTADTTLHVWDWSTGETSRVLKAKCATGMAVSPDGRWIATRDGRVIDSGTGDERAMQEMGKDVQGLRFSPDGKTLAVLSAAKDADGGTVKLLDFPAGTKRCEIGDVWRHTFACAFTADGSQVLLMNKDRFLQRWDAKTGREEGKYEPAFENSIRAIVVSGDGILVAGAGTRGDVYLWERLGGRLIRKLQADQKPDLTKLTAMDSLVFSPDGSTLAGGSFMCVVLWDVRTGASKIMPRDSGGAAQIRFSADGTKMTTIHDFHGVVGPNQMDLLAYPRVKEWEVRQAK